MGMKELLRQLWKQPHTFQIRPENYRVPQDVLDYLLPLLQARMLGSNICSNNEASSYSSVLKIYEVRYEYRALVRPPGILEVQAAWQHYDYARLALQVGSFAGE